ncbi:MAG: hypothetical protein K8W52_32070 [Deltaproteobacteria bacterium]|nr:hypothetical protein [Deltaproteobacteria bacterium]
MADARALARLMQIGAVLGGALACALVISALLIWDNLAEQAYYCGCTHSPHDDRGHVALVLATFGLGIVRAILHARAGRALLAPHAIARRRALAAYLIVAGLHTLAAARFIHHATAPFVGALALWPLILTAIVRGPLRPLLWPPPPIPCARVA